MNDIYCATMMYLKSIISKCENFVFVFNVWLFINAYKMYRAVSCTKPSVNKNAANDSVLAKRNVSFIIML